MLEQIITAIRTSDLDCADWAQSVQEELARSIIAAIDPMMDKAMALLGRTVSHSTDVALRLAAALETIRDLPLAEQDNLLSANMRKIAQEALAKE